MADTQSQPVSTAGHSGRLKYANPQDLPSYPSSGLRKDGAAAGAAASLGWANQKPIDLWQPDKSASASAAAVLAKDYKMAPQWQPDSSSAGARAALLATASAKKQQQQTSLDSDPTYSSRTSWGSSAATQAAAAMRQQMPSTSTPPLGQERFGNSAATSAFRSSLSVRKPPQQTSTSGGDNRDGLGSLSAAKSVMHTNRRPRALSTPVMKDGSNPEARAASSALSAATAAHGPSLQSSRSVASKGGAVPYTALPREMFTSRPNIGPEATEQNRNDQLHASAVAMAKKMYAQQSKMAEQTKAAHHGDDDGSSVEENAPRPYVNLQDAAYKLAQERLAKLEDQYQQNRKYQEYYGSSPAPKNTLQRRWTMKSRLRRRSSSDDDTDDRVRSERIKQEMSIFSNNLSKVDEQKRTHDREALLAAAQRNVRARLQGMDQKLYAETGKSPPPRKLSEWELKAHEAAMAKHETRNVNSGKIDIGGGMFMTQEEIDAIASKKVQPVLDEIEEKAAVERERQEILRSEAEATKKDEEKQKERDREIREINRKIRDQDKAEERERKEAEKKEQKAKRDEEKAKRDQEKAAKAEEKRHLKEEKRKSKRAGDGTGAVVGGDHVDADTDSDENEPMSHIHPQPLDTDIPGQTSPTDAAEMRSPKDAGSPTDKVKSWFKSRFHRPRGKSSAADEKGFVGGATLNTRANESTTSLDNRATSMRDVAMAGRGRETTRNGEGGSNRGMQRDVSPMSSGSDEEDIGDVVGKGKGKDKDITPPRRLLDPNEEKGSPSRDSRFRENLQE